MNRAAFLDRDGTIIHDKEYLSEPAAVELCPFAAEGLRMLRRLGYLLVVVTNQSGIARGYYTEEDMRAVNTRMEELLDEEGVTLDGIYFCPHGPENDCRCRKPQPGMLLEAAADLDIDLAASIMLGDAERDVEAGLNAGCRASILIGVPSERNDVLCGPNLRAAVELIAR